MLDGHKCYRPEMPWTVYLVRSGKLFKIGIAESARRRIRALRNQSALPVQPIGHVIVCCQDGARAIERDLHLRFKDARTHGEWFKLSRFDVYRIRDYFQSPWINLRSRQHAVGKSFRTALTAELSVRLRAIGL
jgi:hypothetical protein